MPLCAAFPNICVQIAWKQFDAHNLLPEENIGLPHFPSFRGEDIIKCTSGVSFKKLHHGEEGGLKFDKLRICHWLNFFGVYTYIEWKRRKKILHTGDAESLNMCGYKNR